MPLGRRCDRAPGTDLFRRQVTVAPRNGYLKRAALAVLALDRYGAAVQLDQLLDQREADAGALVRAAMGTRNAMETLEQLRQLVRRDACAGIAHGELEMRIRLSQPHLDFARESELKGVRQKVENDLLPHLAIDVDGLGMRRAIDEEPQSSLLDRGAEDAGELCRGNRKVGR